MYVHFDNKVETPIPDILPFLGPTNFPIPDTLPFLGPIIFPIPDILSFMRPTIFPIPIRIKRSVVPCFYKN